MKTIFKSILTLGLVAGLGLVANAQQVNVTSTATASANIIAALDIQLDGTNDEINFGQIFASTPGPITLDPKTGTTNAGTSSTTGVAQFNITGADVAVLVKYDSEVDLISGANTIKLTPDVVGAATVGEQGTASSVADNSTVTLAAGKYFLWVGGSIPQLTNQAIGVYTGDFNINVEYN